MSKKNEEYIEPFVEYRAEHGFNGGKHVTKTTQNRNVYGDSFVGFCFFCGMTVRFKAQGVK